jgi:hypothetical protein
LAFGLKGLARAVAASAAGGADAQLVLQFVVGRTAAFGGMSNVAVRDAVTDTNNHGRYLNANNSHLQAIRLLAGAAPQASSQLGGSIWDCR